MDKDFHYYGTYVAARMAGQSTLQAELIAHAAQYVDDSVSSRILWQGHYGIDFQPIPTCHTNFSLVNPITCVSQEEMRHVWVPFHFLPGNYSSETLPDPNAQSRVKEYAGPQDYSWRGDRDWIYNERSQQQFKLICLPQSPLAAAMVNNAYGTMGNTPGPFLAGIIMHVLADTRAHMYYAGTPAWHTNDTVEDDVFELSEGSKRKIRFVYSDRPLLKDWFEPCTPPGDYESIFYLGHGRMGHIPDYPWLKYEYTPLWSPVSIVKDNPEDYLTSFVEMITALKCITTGQSFTQEAVNSTRTQYPDALNAVKNILKQKPSSSWLPYSYDSVVDERCKFWKSGILNHSFGRTPYGEEIVLPREYDPDVWLKEAKDAGVPGIQYSNYYWFNIAAKMHHDFVEKSLKDDGISLTDLRDLHPR
jgi:hypothetical protein